jgi:hypothetical protein
MRIHKRLDAAERTLRRQIVRERKAESVAMSAEFAAMSDEELLAIAKNTEPNELFQNVTNAQLQTLLNVADALYIAGAPEHEIEQRLRGMIAKWERDRK